MRDLMQQRQLFGSSRQVAQEVDVDAEHDPEVARRASNAALDRFLVQFKAARAARESAGAAQEPGGEAQEPGREAKDPVHEAAQRGVMSPATALPHADKIQRAFGAHDISHIQAHIGDGSAAAMGAEAYATGHHVVFAKEPDLHTAAHEAAHVVQQAKGVHLYGGVGQAGDAYEQNADAVADRVVRGESAEDLLGEPAQGSAQTDVVQRKMPPSQYNADQHLLHAVQAHMRLVAARINMAAAQVEDAIAAYQKGAHGEAGVAPTMELIAGRVAFVTDELDGVLIALHRAPELLHGDVLDRDFGILYYAWFVSWRGAIAKISAFTHDKHDRLYDFAQGYELRLDPSLQRMDHILQAVGPGVGRALLPPKIRDEDRAVEQRDEELKAAELDALKASISSVETALELVKADLHSSVSDQSKEARTLTASVAQLVEALEPIDPAHIGKIAKLPILIKDIEALQAEVMKMKAGDEAKGRALAPLLGFGAQLTIYVRKLKAKIAAIRSAHKERGKHHHH